MKKKELKKKLLLNKKRIAKLDNDKLNKVLGGGKITQLTYCNVPWSPQCDARYNKTKVTCECTTR